MQRILVIQTAFIGDVILATSLLEKLHVHYPSAAIDILVRKGHESLFDGHPWLYAVLTFDKKHRWRELWRLNKLIRKNQYDLVVNPHRFFSSGVLVLMSGAEHKVGFKKNPCSFGYTAKFDHTLTDGRHEIERNQLLISQFTDHQAAMPKLYPPRTPEIGQMANGPFVTIAPASVWFTKQWPIEKWVELINLIPETKAIYLLGALGDRPLCDKIVGLVKREGVHNMAGRFSLLESAAIMGEAEMNYANDSAPIHLASAVNAPVTAIFCSTIPGFGFTPLSTHSKVIQTKIALSCRPCGLHGHAQCPEGHFKCADIDPVVAVG
jgi:heptosyltransferase-2